MFSRRSPEKTAGRSDQDDVKPITKPCHGITVRSGVAKLGVNLSIRPPLDFSILSKAAISIFNGVRARVLFAASVVVRQAAALELERQCFTLCQDERYERLQQRVEPAYAVRVPGSSGWTKTTNHTICLNVLFGRRLHSKAFLRCSERLSDAIVCSARLRRTHCCWPEWFALTEPQIPSGTTMCLGHATECLD